jgi:putative sterol carrier protein
MASPAEQLADLVARFRPDAADGIEAVYQLHLTGDGGLPASGGQVWHFVIADRQCRLISGPADNPNVAITVSVTDWDDIASGRIDPFSALVSGRLRVEGDLELATRLQAMFGL